MSRKCLCVVPVRSPITGQSVMSEHVINHFLKSGLKLTIINTNGENKVRKNVRIIFEIIKAYGTYDLIYFTPSRSFTGSIKDLILTVFYSKSDSKICAHIHGADFVDFYSRKSLYMWWLKRCMRKVNIFVVCHDVFKQEVQILYPASSLVTVRNFA